MLFPIWILIFVSLISSTFIGRVDSTSITYVDTLIANFLNKEQSIWEKIVNNSDPLPDIQLIISKDNPDVPIDYIYGTSGDVFRLVASNEFAEPYNILNIFWREIEDSWWLENKENRSNLTIQEIDQRFTKVNTLSNDLFNLTSVDLLWQYGVAKINNIIQENDSSKTSYHFIASVYKHIQQIFLRAYTVCQRFNFLGYYQFQGKYRDQGERLRTEYLGKVSRIRKIAKQYLQMVSKELYGRNKVLYHDYMRYEEITNFLQGYITNEVNLNRDSSCSSTCNDFDKIEQQRCAADTGCTPDRKCNGILRYCKELEDVQICNAKDGKKRYTQVKYEDGRIARNSDQCENEVRLESFTKWFSKCTNCFCLCDDLSDSDRYFSLREVVSNIDANKIVSGVQLHKYNRMIQLNILEQDLKPFGYISDERYSFYDDWEFKGSKFNINDTGVVEGIEYHTLSQENRSISLDTVVVPNGYVVTGVRFGLVNGILTLQVRGTKFDYTSGELINKDNSVWFSNPDSGSEELILGDVAPPFEKEVTPIVNKKPNLFVRFGPTDYWSDISQTTVPLISRHYIYVQENVPLSGVGIYHKNAKSFGGFIAVKLVVLGISDNIPDD